MVEDTNERSTAIRVLATLHNWQTEKSQGRVMAYAFSREARLLGSAALDAKHEATIHVASPRNALDIRIVLGPAMPHDAAPSFVELLRRGAKEQHVRLDPENAEIAQVEFQIFPQIWECWFRGVCFVSGTLLQRQVSGGVSIPYPVCHARVEVYEVEPIWLIINRLPDIAIDHLQTVVAGAVSTIPVPIPGPDPAPFAQRATIGPFAQRATIGQSATARMAVRPSPEVSGALALLISDHPLRSIARLGSRSQFIQEISQYPEIIRPLICYFYPWFVTIEKVAEAYTDSCGHFYTLFFEGCENDDAPNLYFKAYQSLFGFFEVEIYGPTPVACHTQWDYECGTEVTLTTTSPLAVTCLPCPPVIGPDNWVLFTAIGNTSLKAIFGGGASGATLANVGLLTSGAPWGGTLRPRLDFDNSLRQSLGVMYYQLSLRAGLSGSWKPLVADVYRHYAHMVGTDLVISPYRLGPTPMVVGGTTLQLFEIPPAVPPLGQWSVPNGMFDTENGELDSTIASPGLAFNEDGTAVTGTMDGSGLFQLQLELFDANGILIDIVAAGIKYVVPDTADLSGTITTVDASTVAQPGGGSLVVGSTMVLTLHIDNNHCWADLAPPTTAPSGGAADPCCGVVGYAAGDTCVMPYTAYHPNGFATHGINVFRSATTIFTQTGGVGNFNITDTVADMMSRDLPVSCLGTPCVLAAFSEHLDVIEMATDGWGSYLGYNDTDDRAFALAPK